MKNEGMQTNGDLVKAGRTIDHRRGPQPLTHGNGFHGEMKDHEIAQFINDLTQLMQSTPDAQKRAVLSAKLVPVFSENNSRFLDSDGLRIDRLRGSLSKIAECEQGDMSDEQAIVLMREIARLALKLDDIRSANNQ